MAQADLTSVAAAFKTLYPSEAIKNLVYKRNPFFALVPKDETFYGASSTEPITFGTPQNRSSTFSNANTVNTTSQIKAFLLTRVQNYSMAAISNEAMLASESDKGAFLKIAKYEIDNALLALTRAISTQLYRSGTGSIAQLSSSATVNSSSTYVALAQPEDIVNIEYGMNLAFSSADGGSLRAYVSTYAFVISIDRQAGSFLCSATVGGSATALSSLVTSVAASDYVYANPGDLNAVISGLKAWLPGTSVGATTFFGINRTLDKTRLAGIDYNGSSQSIEEALIDGAGLIAREGGNPDHCFVSYKDFRNLVKGLGSKQQFVQYVDARVEEPEVNIGFSALMLNGPNGPMKVIPDQNCPAGSAFLLQIDTWKLKSLGEAVRLFDGDGLTMIRDPNGDNLLIRCFSYAQLSCRAPGWNGVITLPS
jgi:hypothetical protein